MKPSLKDPLWEVAPVNKGLARIQPELFERTLPLLGLRIPVKQTGQFRGDFAESAVRTFWSRDDWLTWADSDVLKRPRVPAILQDPSSQDQRILLLHTDEKCTLTVDTSIALFLTFNSQPSFLLSFYNRFKMDSQRSKYTPSPCPTNTGLQVVKLQYFLSLAEFASHV